MPRLPDEHILITLKDACDIFFGGKISVATLKAEHMRGNLELSKIGRAYFTTPADIKAMREKCRVEVQAPAFGSTRRAERGPSSTDASAAAQDSALKKLRERQQHLRTTSRASTR
jgi:hypothetical protein